MSGMSFKQLFLDAPDSQLDASVKPTIELWDEDPSSLQILRTLDNIVFAGAASGWVVNALDIAMRQAMDREGVTYQQIVELADWRHG